MLTNRELQVAECVILGCSNREIAIRLDVAEKTVEKHLARMLRRLGLQSRMQLAVYITARALAAQRRTDVPTSDEGGQLGP